MDESTDAYDAIDWLVKNSPATMAKLVFLAFLIPDSMQGWPPLQVTRH